MRDLGGLFHTDVPLNEGQASEERLCSIDCPFEALRSVRSVLIWEVTAHQLAATGPTL
jgi:hypothetical protein